MLAGYSMVNGANRWIGMPPGAGFQGGADEGRPGSVQAQEPRPRVQAQERLGRLGVRGGHLAPASFPSRARIEVMTLVASARVEVAASEDGVPAGRPSALRQVALPARRAAAGRCPRCTPGRDACEQRAQRAGPGSTAGPARSPGRWGGVALACGAAPAVARICRCRGPGRLPGRGHHGTAAATGAAGPGAASGRPHAPRPSRSASIAIRVWVTSGPSLP